MEPKEGIYIAPILLYAIGAFITIIVIPAASFVFTQLWKDRNAAYKENIDLLKAQFADTSARKSLWDDQASLVKDLVRETAALKQQWVDFLNEYRRKNP